MYIKPLLEIDWFAEQQDHRGRLKGSARSRGGKYVSIINSCSSNLNTNRSSCAQRHDTVKGINSDRYPPPAPARTNDKLTFFGQSPPKTDKMNKPPGTMTDAFTHRSRSRDPVISRSIISNSEILTDPRPRRGTFRGGALINQLFSLFASDR